MIIYLCVCCMLLLTGGRYLCMMNQLHEFVQYIALEVDDTIIT